MRPKEDKPKRLTNTGEALAGAFSGGFSRFLVAPLDVVKIRFQLQVEPISKAGAAGAAAAGAAAGGASRPYYTSVPQALRSLVKEEGLRTLWRGNLAAMLLWIGYAGVQFPLYRWMKDNPGVWHWGGGEAPSPATVSLVSGGVAGGVATAVTYPLDWIRTRYASQGVPRIYHSIPHMLRVEAARPGPGASPAARVAVFFRGLTPTLAAVVPQLAVTFYVYERVGAAWRRGVRSAAGLPAPGSASGEQVPPHSASSRALWATLEGLAPGVAGGVAGITGKLLVYPLDTVKKRLQVSGMARSAAYGATRSYSGSIDALVRIAKEEGILRGWFKGTVPALLKACMAATLAFSAYELGVGLLTGVVAPALPASWQPALLRPSDAEVAAAIAPPAEKLQ